jgi:MFS family permease
MLKVVKPSTWLAVCMIGWGAMSTLQAVCHNGASLAAVRFFLGLFEASFAPGCALYLSFWYLKTELSFRIACYAGTSALSGVFGGLIAYGLGKNNATLVIPAWKTLFIVEGIPTVVLGILTYFYLPNRPETGRHRWFTEEEHQALLSRRNRFVRNQDNGIDLQQVAG